MIKNYIVLTGEDRDKNGWLHKTIAEIGFFKNSNGKKLQLFLLNSGGDAEERGVLAVVPETGKIKWQFLMGPQVVNPIIDDIDGDGLTEIVLGSYAPGNGAEYNGTQDDSCYVFMLDCDGKLRWRKTMGPYFTGVFPILIDINRDGKKELVVYNFGTNEQITGQDEIIRLNVNNGNILKPGKKVGTKFPDPKGRIKNFCGDFTGDGNLEFVIGNKDGIVRMFGENLATVNSSQCFKHEVRVEKIGDLNGDKIPEVICQTDDGQLLVLNHELKLLAKREIPVNCTTSLVKTHKKNLLLIMFGKNDKGYEFNLIDFHQVGFAQQAIDQSRQYLLWIVLGFFVIILALIIRNVFWGSQSKRILFSFLDNAGLLIKALIVSRSGRIIKIGKDWKVALKVSLPDCPGKKYEQLFTQKESSKFRKELTAIFKKQSLEQTVDVYAAKNYRLQSKYIPLLRIYVILLIDLTEQEHIRQVKHWAQVAQKLAHGIKNPLTTVKLNAEDLKHTLQEKYQIENKEIDEYFEAIIGQVTKLKKMSDGFMRFVEFEKPDLKPTDLNKEIEELIPQWQPERTAGIKIEWELEENLPPAMIDKKQFEYALRNVFFNAVESMESGGRIIIFTQIVDLFLDKAQSTIKNRYVEVRIRDTGCGIPAEFLDKVMLPYFSLNKIEGTGLGLCIVKKIMDSHEGLIDIYSEVNQGTTVTLRFKTKN